MRIFSLICSFVLILLLSMCGGVEQIDAGNRGVKTVWGEVQEGSMPEGLYFYNPFSSSIHELECKTQRMTMELNTYTKDVQNSDLTVIVNYNLDPNNAHLMFKEVGKSYEDRILKPQIDAAVKNTIGKWEASAIPENREKINQEIVESLKTDLADKHIKITGAVISEIKFSKAFESAIEDKQIATEKAKEAKNRTQQIKEEKDQQILQAQGEAESMRIRSNALSKNKNLVSYEAVHKWNGNLPMIMDSESILPFIGEALTEMHKAQVSEQE